MRAQHTNELKLVAVRQMRRPSQPMYGLQDARMARPLRCHRPSSGDGAIDQ